MTRGIYFAAALAMSLMGGTAQAALLTFSGDTTAGPTYNRTLAGTPPTGTSAVGTAVRYNSFTFGVAETASYNFLTTAQGPGYDTFLALYQGGFNASAPLTNVVVANDDLTTGNFSQSGFTRTLTAGLSYTAVITGFDNTDFGAFTFAASTDAPVAVSSPNDIFTTGSTVGGPTFNRPLAGSPPTGTSGVGTAVSYNSFTFGVDTSENYVFLLSGLTANYDTFLALYQGVFNPSTPLANVLVANDDLTTGNFSQSGFVRALVAGQTYTAVVTGFDNTDRGDYSLRIRAESLGPVVPEPATWAMMIVGFAAVGGSLRSRRKVAVTFA